MSEQQIKFRYLGTNFRKIIGAALPGGTFFKGATVIEYVTKGGVTIRAYSDRTIVIRGQDSHSERAAEQLVAELSIGEIQLLPEDHPLPTDFKVIDASPSQPAKIVVKTLRRCASTAPDFRAMLKLICEVMIPELSGDCQDFIRQSGIDFMDLEYHLTGHCRGEVYRGISINSALAKGLFILVEVGLMRQKADYYEPSVPSCVRLETLQMAIRNCRAQLAANGSVPLAALQSDKAGEWCRLLWRATSHGSAPVAGTRSQDERGEVNRLIAGEYNGACYMLIEGPPTGSARPFAGFLNAAADADLAFFAMLDEDADVQTALGSIQAAQYISFQISALEVMDLVRSRGGAVVINVFRSTIMHDLAVMALLGFLKWNGERYQINIPQNLTMDDIRAATLRYAATEDEGYYLHPEVVINLMTAADVERQLKQIEGSIEVECRCSEELEVSAEAAE
ncbi:hypothetical protein AB8B21_27875 [Tardiphaga sp. 866_E4_N2_1]|uniref:hypothetical protein n=1 Tax=unclassified Tardiphaga TaxID=2631404 RepID=UPI003F25A835